MKLPKMYIVPKKRDLQAKRGYKFLSWFIRYHSWKTNGAFEKTVSKAIEDMFLFGIARFEIPFPLVASNKKTPDSSTSHEPLQEH